MDEEPLSDLWCFDWEDKTWCQFSENGEVPEARSFHQMVPGQASNSNKLYVFGGCAKKGRLNDLYEFDIKGEIWKKLPTSADIKGRGGACFTAIGNDLYVIAGFAGEETSDVHKYSNGIWTKLTDFPSQIAPRSVAAVCSLPSLGMICVFGGELSPSARGHEGAGNFSNEVLCLPTTGNQVVYVPKVKGIVPVARGWLNCALLKEETEKSAQIVFFGGLKGNDENPVRCNDMWTIHIELND